MNIKLVKLTAEYKEQLTDMMDEWLAVEKDFSPYAIRKNDYHDFEYYLENLETKEGEKPGLVPDSVYFCLDIDRNIFVGAVNIRHYLNESLYKSGGHIGDGIRPSERRKGYCEEACTAVMNLFFSEGVSVDHTRISGRKLYATTLSDNRPVMQLLSKLGFTENIPEDGKVLIMEGFVDEETDEFFGYCVAKYVLVREEGDSGDSTIS